MGSIAVYRQLKSLTVADGTACVIENNSVGLWRTQMVACGDQRERRLLKFDVQDSKSAIIPISTSTRHQVGNRRPVILFFLSDDRFLEASDCAITARSSVVCCFMFTSGLVSPFACFYPGPHEP